MAASARVVVGLVLVGLPAVAAAGWPLGSVLTDSALVDVTERGFDAVEDLVAGLLPPRVDIDDVDLFDEDCIDPFDLICYSYDISVTNLYVIPSLDTLSIQPGQQVLNLDGDLTVTLSSAADPAILDFEAEAIGISIGDNCTVHTDPIPISLDSAIQMNLLPDPAGVDIDGDGVSDTNVLDATVPPISTYLGATSDDLHFDDCTTADVVNVLNDVLSFFGLDIYQLLLDQLDPQVEALVAELPPLIEVLLEGTFSTLTLEEEIDLLGVPLELTVWPSTLDLTT